MKNFLGILRYLIPYKGISVGYVVTVLFSIIFSVVSLTMLIPFLSLLFGTQELTTSVDPFSFSVKSITDHFSYYLSQIIIEKGKNEALVFICIFIISLILLKNLFFWTSQVIMATIRNHVIRDLRLEIFGQVIKLPLSFYNEERKGDIIARMTTDVQEVENSIVNSLVVFFREPFTIIAFVGTMFFISPKLTFFIMILLPLTGFVINKIARSLKKKSDQGQKKLGFLLSIIEETMTGLRIIKGFGAQEYIEEKFKNHNQDLTKIMIKLHKRRSLSSPVSEVMGVMVLVVVLFVGGKMVLGEDSTLSASMFIGYIAVFSQVINPAKSLSNAIFNIIKGMSSYDRILQILNEPVTIKDTPNAQDVAPLEDKIEFKNVSFSYKEKEVLTKINLEIPKGQTIALVGQSGAGKSTMADLLPRFYDIQDGEISMDGVPIKEIKLKSLIAQMGIVTQDPILFNDTIFNNIAFGSPNATLDQIENASRIANAHDFIIKTEDGYQTIIGDGGGRLSGGQRQRISIARAILKNPPILILDEATSALDTESERLVQEALNKLMENRTTLVIAHRLSTIQHAHKIVVMHEGEIKETGTHDELISLDGIYNKLCKMQSFT
ncbi:MAG: subfamily B ATP-binding cassette protein MsbA [Sphingobacteriales bacterium]|jgi:subfamily B ATP-binding cassette protein MsbA